MIEKKSKPKIKKSARSKKMELKKSIIEQYNLPFLECNRFAKGKHPTRIEILAGLLWTVFAKWVRQRDEGKCISCGKPKTRYELQAGHYSPLSGSKLDLWFDEKNVNGECYQCNADFHGWHLIPMRINLISKWGEEAVLDIEKRRRDGKLIIWSEQDYVDKILYYNNQLNK